MKIEEFEKIKKELLEEKEKNNKQIEKNEKRMKIASANSLENKLLSISGLSAIGYLFFFLTFSEITKVGLTIFNNIIQTLSFPIIIIGSSLCFGTLMNHCISKGLKIKEKYKITTELINDVGAVIGAHSGPGTMALFFLGDVR